MWIKDQSAPTPEHFEGKNMRVAIALSGEMRGKDGCLCLLQDRVVQPFLSVGATVDLFCHTRKDDWWTPASKLRFRCLWVEENHKRDDADIVNLANPRSLGDRKGDDRRAFLYQSYLQQYWSLEAVGAMVARAQLQDGVRYDWVVRSRPDVYMEQPLDITSLDRGRINMPWNDWWPYEIDGKRIETCSDKFAVGRWEYMCWYFFKLQYLKQFCATNRLQGEAFTAWQLDHLNIPWHRHDKIKCLQTDDPYIHSIRP